MIDTPIQIPDTRQRQLSEFIGEMMGLHFPPERWPDLQRGLAGATDEFGFTDAAACADWLLSAPLTKAQLQVLASHLTIGETYFFREKKTFEVLASRVLPELVGRRRDRERHLRLWSAGCCTGEEAYSLAIAVCQAIPDWKDWQLTILATDINPNFLKRAALGEYNEWSFRDAPAWLKETYFQKTAGRRFQIAPQIKRLVTFSYLNLAEDAYPSLATNTNGMDVIFCRNVLMYFKPEWAERAVRNLHRCLADEGWLVVSPTEASPGRFSQFASVLCDGMPFYRKSSHPAGGPTSSEAETGATKGCAAFGLGDLVPPDLVPPDLVPPDLVPPDLAPSPSVQGHHAWHKAKEPFDEPGKDGFHSAPDFSRPAGREIRDAVERVPTGFEVLPASPEEKIPVSARTPYQEASMLFAEGRWSEAAQQLAALTVGGLATPEVFALLARCCANEGKLTDARDWSDQAIARAKLSPGLHYLRATILQEQGDFAEAASSLKRALYLDPDFVLAHFALAHLALRRQKSRLATKHFENVLSLLNAHPPESVLPESDGMTAGRLREIVQTTIRPNIAYNEPVPSP